MAFNCSADAFHIPLRAVSIMTAVISSRAAGFCRSEIVLYAQTELVLHIYIVYLVPQLVVYGIGFHHVPTVSVLYDFGETGSDTRPALHLLADVCGVEDGGAALHADGLFQLLHAHVVAVAVVAHICVGVLARDIAHGEVHPSHELVNVVEAQRSPCIALAGLYYGIRVAERRFQSEPPYLFP